MTNETILEKITAIITERIEADPAEITPETALTELGADSLDIIDIAMEIEDTFGVEIDVNGSLTTVEDLAAAVADLCAEK